MTRLHFYRFEDCEDGKMAILDSLDAPCPYPVNVYIDNYADAAELVECDVVIDMHGVCSDMKVYESEGEIGDNGMTPVSLIPIGTFPLNPDDSPSPYVMFSGKVAYVEKNPDPQGELNCFLRIETYGMMISTYIHSDNEIRVGNIVSGVAWLYGDMLPESRDTGQTVSE